MQLLPCRVVQPSYSNKKVLDRIKHPSSGASYSIPKVHNCTTLPKEMLFTAQPFSSNEKKNKAHLSRGGMYETCNKRSSDAITPDFSAMTKKTVQL
jgi:hypothetical protein